MIQAVNPLNYFSENPAEWLPLPNRRLNVAAVIYLLSALGPGYILFVVCRELMRGYVGDIDLMVVLAGMCSCLVALTGGLGLGLFLRRRWSIALGLPVARSWLVIGVFITALPAFDILAGMYESRRAADFAYLLRFQFLLSLVLMLFLCLVLPGVLIGVLRDPRLPAAIAQRDLRPRWTDARSPAELAMTVTLATFVWWAGVVAFVDISGHRGEPRAGAVVTPLIALGLFAFALVLQLLRTRLGWLIAATADAFTISVAGALLLRQWVRLEPSDLDSNAVIECGATLVACVRLTTNLWRSRPWAHSAHAMIGSASSSP